VAREGLLNVSSLRGYAKHKMRPFIIDVAWSVSLRVCLLVISVNCAKMAEPIETSFTDTREQCHVEPHENQHRLVFIL